MEQSDSDIEMVEKTENDSIDSDVMIDEEQTTTSSSSSTSSIPKNKNNNNNTTTNGKSKPTQPPAPPTASIKKPVANPTKQIVVTPTGSMNNLNETSTTAASTTANVINEPIQVDK